MLYLLTGEIERGKTTWLKALIAKALEKGVVIDGVITPAVFKDGEKIGIDCLLLPKGEVFPFGKRADLLDGSEKTFDAKLQLRWVFEDAAMTRINEHLSTITGERPSKTLFLIDELGCLELLKKQGFTEALRILDDGCYADAIVVVRPSLLDIAQERFAAGAGGADCIKVIGPDFEYRF